MQALETFGTDFSLIAEMFPTRPRRAIKSKYLRESKTSLVGSCSLPAAAAASRHASHCTHRPWRQANAVVPRASSAAMLQFAAVVPDLSSEGWLHAGFDHDT